MTDELAELHKLTREAGMLAESETTVHTEQKHVRRKYKG